MPSHERYSLLEFTVYKITLPAVARAKLAVRLGLGRVEVSPDNSATNNPLTIREKQNP